MRERAQASVQLDVSLSFSQFVDKYARQYTPGTKEYIFREAMFQRHVRAVKEHNSKNNKNTFVAAVNHLADWTAEELAGLRGYRKHAHPSNNKVLHGHSKPALASTHKNVTQQPILPESFSWSQLQAIQEDRDQFDCGSCWAFAADIVMRSHSAIHYKPQNLSVGQIVACTPNPNQCGGSGGCGGATCELAFEYALLHGLADEKTLPYNGGRANCPQSFSADVRRASSVRFLQDGTESHQSPHGGSFSVGNGNGIGMTGWQKFPENRLEPLMRALVEKGPVAAAVAAGFEWNLYSSGIMALNEYPTWIVNHAVVLFGYGRDQGTKYWYIKNSWGNHWGENGNIRLQRPEAEEKYCGIDVEPEVGTGCKGGPSQVKVCGSLGVLYDAAIPIFGNE